ncbi:MAG: four helix bundle protein [Bacteroidota bacterium]|nr:four helix bundle protein [Bacteroidota bacterium]
MKINNFEDLEVWQLARDLSKTIYKYSSSSPFNKDFRFRSQILSSSGSIMDNIAEGFERDGNKEFIQFLSISKGSCGETRSQSYRAFDFKYINQDQLNELLTKTKQLSNSLGGFIKYLKSSEIKGKKFKN